MTILYTLLAALALGLTLNRLKVPGGMMIGAVIGASITNMALSVGPMPAVFKTIAQIVAGAFIGSGVNRKDISDMRRALLPAGIVVVGLFVMNLLSGYAIHRLFGMDLLTAFMSTAPGGISDMPIAAADMGADASKVLVMQFVRYLIGIGVFPSLIGRIDAKAHGQDDSASSMKGSDKSAALPVILTMLVATASGLLGKLSGLPAGTMAFATIGSIAFKLLYQPAHLPKLVRKAAQGLSGAYVGATIGVTELLALGQLAGPAVILILSLATGTLVIGTVLNRRGVFSRKEALLAATPAGASDMALISADLGIRNVKLVLLQVMRMICVITLFPTLLHLVAQWLT